MCRQLFTLESTLSPVPCGTASFEWLSVQHSFLDALAERGTQTVERHRKKWYREQLTYNLKGEGELLHLMQEMGPYVYERGVVGGLSQY